MAPEGKSGDADMWSAPPLMGRPLLQWVCAGERCELCWRKTTSPALGGREVEETQIATARENKSGVTRGNAARAPSFNGCVPAGDVSSVGGRHLPPRREGGS